MWEEKGITGRANRDSSMMRLLLEMYRGNHWASAGMQGWGGLRSEELAITNKVYTTANSLESDLTARNPKILVRPLTEEYAPSRGAIEVVYNYDVREQNMIRQFRRALHDHLAAPLGIVRHGYTPEDEFEAAGQRFETYRPARPNRPWIRRWPLWDTLLDPRCESFHADGGCTWVAFRTLMRKEQIQKNPNMTLPRGLAPNVSQDWLDMRPDSLRDKENPDVEGLYEVWTVYEEVERTWFQLALDGPDKWLRKPADWPIPWEHKPVNVLGINEQSDTPFPVALLEEMIPVQQELNKLRTIMSKVARRTRRLVGVDGNRMEPDEFEKLTTNEDVMEFFQTKGAPKDAIQQIQVGTFPTELLTYHALLEEDIRELSGQSKMDRGQRINVETAAEAGRVGFGSDRMALRLEKHFREFIDETFRLYAQGRRFTAAADPRKELVPLLGMEDVMMLQEEFLTVDPLALAGEYDFRVELGSTLPVELQREVQLAAADLQLAASMPDTFRVGEMARRYAESRGMDPRRVLTQEVLVGQRVRQVADIRDRAGLEPNTPPTPGIDPRAFAPGAGGGSVQ